MQKSETQNHTIHILVIMVLAWFGVTLVASQPHDIAPVEAAGPQAAQTTPVPTEKPQVLTVMLDKIQKKTSWPEPARNTDYYPIPSWARTLRTENVDTALILAIARRLPEARDNQHKKVWRGMLGDLTQREDELGGKTLLVVGMGRIGSHLALLAKAFGMKVIGIRRDPSQGENGADSIYGMADLVKLVPQADYVALTCALTPETTGLMSAAAFAAMKPSSVFVNVARGKVADEEALIRTMQGNKIWAAAIDVTAEEPLPATSPLWSLPNVFITPHTAGETRAYEDNVLDILMENLDRLWRGEKSLRNQAI